MVREDREDRDVKAYNAENGIPSSPPPPAAMGERAGRGPGRGAGRGAGRSGGVVGGRGAGRGGRGPPADRPAEATGESTGCQVPRGKAMHGEGTAERCLPPGQPPTNFARCPVYSHARSLQVYVNGLPWSYTWKELKPMFDGIGTVVRADIAYGRDGRSRVRG